MPEFEVIGSADVSLAGYFMSSALGPGTVDASSGTYIHHLEALEWMLVNALLYCQPLRLLHPISQDLETFLAVSIDMK